MKKTLLLTALSGLFILSSCKKEKDEDDKNNGGPQPISLEDAAAGSYSVDRFSADLDLTVYISGFPVQGTLTADGSNYVGSVSFDRPNQKVAFDFSMDLEVMLAVGGQGTPVTDTTSIVATMSFEILTANRIRFYVKDGTSDTPIVLVNGFEIDDITFDVTERLTTSLKLKGYVDAELEIPGLPAGGVPATGDMYFDLKR